jgi:hypothetical protein
MQMVAMYEEKFENNPIFMEVYKTLHKTEDEKQKEARHSVRMA